MAEPETAVPIIKKKSRLVSWLLLSAVLVLLSGGGFLARRYFLSPDPAATEAITEVKSVMNLDSFLVNLADDDYACFVKATFRLGLDDSGLGKEYANDQVVLAATRDKIITLLSTMKAEELLTSEGKARLRREIREQVNKILPHGKVVEVFIMEFVVQL